jgi:lipoprotein-anchoring transpeptidase ErfK/SrfK
VSQPNPKNIQPSGQLSPKGDNVPPDGHESIPLTEASKLMVQSGIAAARQGHRDAAISQFDQALSINEDDVEALLWRGGLSEPNESLPFLERALALDPTNPRVRRGLEWARSRVGLAAPGQTPATAPKTMPVRQAQPAPSTKDSSQTRSTVSAAALAGSLSGIAAKATSAISTLIERPMLAFMIAMLILGALGTMAVARAGMNQNSTETGSLAPQALPTMAGVALASSTTNNAAALPVATPALASVPAGPVTVMTLDQAWAAGDWAQSVSLLENLKRRTPWTAELNNKLFLAYKNHGTQLIQADKLAEGIAQLDKALQINATDEDVQNERKFAQLYMQGMNYLAKNDPGMAVGPFRNLFDARPNYRDAKTKLYQSYVAYAAELEKEGKKSDAFIYFKKASQVDPKGGEAQEAMIRLKDSAPASALNPTNKKIEVSISSQSATVWENGKVLWKFKVSTGRGQWTTRVGNFEILDKMPTAYSSALGWKMPYWMGVYQAGGTENGFHGLATLSNGTTLPASTVGRPATSGCIMLTNEDAATLYNWASIGTPVTIHN